jgi:WD40 repeat protein
MPNTADFIDDTVLQETFMSFRSAPLPPSSHTAAEASATVRWRRRARVALAAVGVISVIAVPIAAYGLTTSRPHALGPGVGSRPYPVESSHPATSSPSFTGTLRDAGEVRDVAFSPDGTLIATAGGNDHNVVLWSTATGERVRLLAGSAVVDSIAFSPDGKLLATGSEIFDLATGAPLHDFAGGAYDVAFSPDGSLIATANGYMPNGVRLFSASTGRLASQVTGDYANALAFSPDGKQLAAATGYLNQGVVVWDAAAGTKIRTLAGGSGSVAYSPDGKFVATGGGKVELWNPTSGAPIRELDATDVLAFSPDGRMLAATGHDKAVRLYDPATGNPIRTLTGVYADQLAFSPDGTHVAMVAPDNTVQVAALG